MLQAAAWLELEELATTGGASVPAALMRLNRGQRGASWRAVAPRTLDTQLGHCHVCATAFVLRMGDE